MKLHFISLNKYINEQEELPSDEKEENPEAETIEGDEEEMKKVFQDAIDATGKQKKSDATPNQKLSDQKIVTSPSGLEIDMDELKQKMESAKATVLVDSPLLGPYIRNFTPIYTWEIDTMATDGVRLFVNPEFAHKLTWEQVIFVILHEILHCVLLHIQRFKENNKIKTLMNTSSDFDDFR